MTRKNWTREELILAFNLYCKTPFGKIHVHNPDIIELANLIKRTPSAVSWKLANFSRLDPVLRQRNISGATHGSNTEIQIWEEFNNNWEELSFESEKLLANLKQMPIEIHAGEDIDFQKIKGKEAGKIVKVRVNQNFFRHTVLASYGFRCCITNLGTTELLNASHIIPWSKDKENRVNPRNGICLNALHDRAFDRGYVTITNNYKVKVSKKLKGNTDDTSTFLLKFDGLNIRMPERFTPDLAFLKYHQKEIFLH